MPGRNGAGKSTYTRGAFQSGFLLLDPDRYGISSNDEAGPFTSGRAVVERVRQALASREDFVLETTLSGRFPMSVLEAARRDDYEITLLFVGLDDPDECLRRIEERVRGGGHPVPEEDVRRRLVRSIANLSIAVLFADHVVIYDNGTHSGPYTEVIVFSNGSATVTGAVPGWAIAAAEALARGR